MSEWVRSKGMRIEDFPPRMPMPPFTLVWIRTGSETNPSMSPPLLWLCLVTVKR